MESGEVEYTEAENRMWSPQMGARGPRTKEYGKHPEVGRGKIKDCPLNLQKEQPCQHLDFTPGRTILDF